MSKPACSILVNEIRQYGYISIRINRNISNPDLTQFHGKVAKRNGDDGI